MGNGAREYNPATGRFNQPDPGGFATSGPNLYDYAANAPTNGTDPSGYEDAKSPLQEAQGLLTWFTDLNKANGGNGVTARAFQAAFPNRKDRTSDPFGDLSANNSVITQTDIDGWLKKLADSSLGADSGYLKTLRALNSQYQPNNAAVAGTPGMPPVAPGGSPATAGSAPGSGGSSNPWGGGESAPPAGQQAQNLSAEEREQLNQQFLRRIYVGRWSGWAAYYSAGPQNQPSDFSRFDPWGYEPYFKEHAADDLTRMQAINKEMNVWSDERQQYELNIADKYNDGDNSLDELYKLAQESDQIFHRLIRVAQTRYARQNLRAGAVTAAEFADPTPVSGTYEGVQLINGGQPALGAAVVGISWAPFIGPLAGRGLRALAKGEGKAAAEAAAVTRAEGRAAAEASSSSASKLDPAAEARYRERYDAAFGEGKAAAPANPAVGEVAGQVTRPGQDIASIINTISRLEEGQARNIQTVRNIIRDHAKPSDFSGVALERAGGSIPKPGGGVFDHVGEMRQSVRNLRDNATRLRNSLKDPSHPPDVRAYVESQIRVADEMIARMEAALR
jgi:hypothetical protein